LGRAWCDKDPSSYYAWGRLGQVFEKRGEFERAMHFYEHAISVIALPSVVSPEVEAVLVAYFNNLLKMYLQSAASSTPRRRFRSASVPLQLFTVYRSHFVGALVQLYSMPGPQQNRARVAELQRADPPLPTTTPEAAVAAAAVPTMSMMQKWCASLISASSMCRQTSWSVRSRRLKWRRMRAPHVAAAHYAVAVVLKSLHIGEQQATERLKRAFELEPHNQEYSNTYFHSLKAVADWDSLAPLLPKWRAEIEAGTRALHPFSCLMFGLSPEVLLRESLRFGEQHAAMAAHLAKNGAAPVFDAATRRGARLRAQCDDGGSCDAMCDAKAAHRLSVVEFHQSRTRRAVVVVLSAQRQRGGVGASLLDAHGEI
jgi:tetratricopeptide (TPR) repeat protein